MKPFHVVHQFHSGTAMHDAVTQHMLEIRQHLVSLGFRSEIFAEHVDPGLVGQVRPVADYPGSADTLLLVHHSMGNEGIERVLHLPDTIVTVYHNVTPAEFFGDPTTQRFARLGREQLALLARRSRLGVADSNFNRKEMLAAGFRRVEVLPPRTDFSSVRDAATPHVASSNWLFVGRLVENKAQVDLVRAFAASRRRFGGTGRLILVGDCTTAYAHRVRLEARTLGVEDRLEMWGKVPVPQLCAAFSEAGVFVSMSEHEGFGVPILEAMAAGVPVVAYAAAAVPETMGGAGILLRTKDPEIVAAAVHTVLTDDGLARRLVSRQRRRMAQIESIDVPTVLQRVVALAAGRSLPLRLQVQGPFETSYSLALMNRRLALALHRAGTFDVSIYATEGPGDYQPDPDDLARLPDATALYRRSSSVLYPDVAIREMWPPRLIDSAAGITCQYFGWEESAVPQSIVDEFNSFADGIGAMSEFVADALRRSGVTVPVAVVGNGVVAPDPDATCRAPELVDLRGFVFLHISSAFPRKGVDVLLRAYFSSFRGADDVSLVLKTFPNPHNEVAQLLDELRREAQDPPDVRWIDRDLPGDEIDGLYGVADCLVHPARGEGFGLPVAEAMLARVPVIAPASTGMADFVSDRTARTIPFHFEPAATHVSVPGSTWAEPDEGALGAAMRAMVDDPSAPVVTQRVDAAERLVRERYSWEAAAARWTAFVGELRDGAQPVRVGLVSTWNVRCGIAEYAKHLVTHAPEGIEFAILANRDPATIDPASELGVSRTWANQWEPELDTLEDVIEDTGPEVIHLQFNFGFFGLPHVGALIDRQHGRRGIVVTLHRTADGIVDGRTVSLASIADQLAKADALIVHQPQDAETLAAMGLSANVRVVPHGTPEPAQVAREQIIAQLGLGGRLVVGTFGFAVPHKGLLELVEVVDRIRKDEPAVVLVALCAEHPDPISGAYIAEVRRAVASRGVEEHVLLVTEFLDDAVCRTALRAADVIALPYLQTQESASGAMRTALSAGRPMIVSDLPIFGDALEVAISVPPGNVDALEEAIRRVLADPALRDKMASASQAVARRYSWREAAAQHRAIYLAARRRARRDTD